MTWLTKVLQVCKKAEATLDIKKTPQSFAYFSDRLL